MFRDFIRSSRDVNRTDIKTLPLIHPDWRAPSWVKAVQTTRIGGISAPPWNEMNLAFHVGDAPEHVRVNRERIRRITRMPAEPFWLQQIHGNHLVHGCDWRDGINADGLWTDQPKQVCAVLTADCLPVLLCGLRRRWVSALHIGWRGLADGIIESALPQFPDEPECIMAWIGPGISQQRFTVDDPVYRELEQAHCLGHHYAYPSLDGPSRDGRWAVDLAGLTGARLRQAGVRHIYSSPWRTDQQSWLYSWRRDGVCGRQGAFIWLQAP